MEYTICVFCNGMGRMEFIDSFSAEIRDEVCPVCQGHGRPIKLDDIDEWTKE